MENFIDDIFQNEVTSSAVIETAKHGAIRLKGIFNNDITVNSLSGFKYGEGEPYFFCKTYEVKDKVSARDKIIIEDENDGLAFFIENPIQHGSGANKGLTKFDLRRD